MRLRVRPDPLIKTYVWTCHASLLSPPTLCGVDIKRGRGSERITKTIIKRETQREREKDKEETENINSVVSEKRVVTSGAGERCTAVLYYSPSGT